MPYTLEYLPDTRVKITVTVPAETVVTAMHKEAEQVAKGTAFQGFRPGKAPYEVVKERIGEMKLLEQATEGLIRTSLSAALFEEDLNVVGQPYFNVEKLVPDNEFIYTAEFALMPEVTKLVDYTTLSVKGEPSDLKEETFEQAKTDLLRMRTIEVRGDKDLTLAKGHKTVVNMSMKRNGVALEGGEAQNHGIYTGEEYYIAGFIEQILGAKEGEERAFQLTFPKDHYQKHLAGEPVDFVVSIKEIHTLETPNYDETFAVSLGFKDLGDLEVKLRQNLSDEKRDQETRRQDKAMLELLAEKSSFPVISDLLLNQEIDKMIYELRQWVTENGMEFDGYLKSVKKTVPDLKLDFAKQALIRIKVALILEEVAKIENIAPTPEELDAEVDRIGAQVAKDPAAKEHIFSPEYRDRIEAQLRNRKAVDFLRATMIK